MRSVLQAGLIPFGNTIEHLTGAFLDAVYNRLALVGHFPCLSGLVL